MQRSFWILAAMAVLLSACSSVSEKTDGAALSFGTPQKGKASWYGPGFQGRKTANGERYNMNALTAAHRTLAFGTKICVENLDNGKSVTLRVNDRGPFIRGRVVDVSRQGARSLGMVRSGTAPVRVTMVKEEEKSGRTCRFG